MDSWSTWVSCSSKMDACAWSGTDRPMTISKDIPLMDSFWCGHPAIPSTPTSNRCGSLTANCGPGWGNYSCQYPGAPPPRWIAPGRISTGDEVHAVMPDEPTEIKLQGSTLYFPQKTRDRAIMTTTSLYFPSFIWMETAFAMERAHWCVLRRILTRKVVIRNGGGRTIARVGDWVNMKDYTRSGPSKTFPKGVGAEGRIGCRTLNWQKIQRQQRNLNRPLCK